MRNIKMTIRYDGSRYKGFQRLKDNNMTIQGKIEDVLSKMVNENIEIIGSGRTDMGVHAYGQVANFKTNSNLSIEKMQSYLYEYLPEDIVITNIEEVNERFHSRYNAKSKVYLYKIYNNKFHDPFLRKHTTHIPKKLDIELMKEASKYFIGEHDFTSFASSKSKKKSNVRTIYSINITENNGLLEIYFEGNGFLYNMVRIIAGTLVDVGMGKIKPEEVKEIIESKDRQNAGKTLKPQGLYLVKVEYE